MTTSETLEQIAERESTSFAEDWSLTTETQRDLEYVLLSALRNEREACAKVADTKAAYHVERHRDFLSRNARAASYSGSMAEACSEVAAAIREGR